MILRAGASLAPVTGDRLAIQLSGRLTIESGASIYVSGLGYAGGDATHFDGHAPEGVRPATLKEGGAHGGSTPGDFGETYDSVYLPTLPGGGGAIAAAGSEGGAGGGTVILEVGELILDGDIIARGIGRGRQELGKHQRWRRRGR